MPSSTRRTPRPSRARSPLPSHVEPQVTVAAGKDSSSSAFLKHPVGCDVKLKVIIKRIDHVDTEKQTFFADIWTGAWDVDVEKPSFAQYFQGHHHDMSVFDCCKPQWTISFQNVQDLFHFYKYKMLPETRKVEDGHFIRVHTQGTFSSVFHLSMFPFDRQLLKIKISLDVPSSIARIGKVEVFKDKENFDALLNSEWEIDKSINNGDPYVLREDRCASDVGSYGNSYSTVTIAQNIKRNPNHFIMTAFFPLFIIMSCSFIMIHPTDIINLMLDQSDKKLEMDKLSYLSTMLLSVIALRFSFVDKMPRIPYLSLFDLVFMLSYWILFNMMCVAAEQRLYSLLSVAFFPFVLLFKRSSIGFVMRYFRRIFHLGGAATPCAPATDVTRQ